MPRYTEVVPAPEHGGVVYQVQGDSPDHDVLLTLYATGEVFWVARYRRIELVAASFQGGPLTTMLRDARSEIERWLAYQCAEQPTYVQRGPALDCQQ